MRGQKNLAAKNLEVYNRYVIGNQEEGSGGDSTLYSVTLNGSNLTEIITIPIEEFNTNKTFKIVSYNVDTTNILNYYLDTDAAIITQTLPSDADLIIVDSIVVSPTEVVITITINIAEYPTGDVKSLIVL